MSEIAHLGPAEMYTPKGEESLAFFVDVMGMEIEAQDGPATYLRGWGDYQRWSLKLIASDTSGMGVLGLRAWSPEALERRVAAIEATGLGEGWTDGDLGRGASYRFRDPDGHRFELYYECERYTPPDAAARASHDADTILQPQPIGVVLVHGALLLAAKDERW